MTRHLLTAAWLMCASSASGLPASKIATGTGRGPGCEQESQRLAAALQKPAASDSQWQARLKEVKAVVGRAGKRPECGEILLQARLQEAEALRGLGRHEEARAVYAAVVAGWKERKFTAQANPNGTGAAAQAAHALAGYALQPLDAPGGTPAGRLEAFKAGLGAYDEVAAFSVPEWSVSAAVRQAEATERLVQSLSTPAYPEGQRRAALEVLERYRSTQDGAFAAAEASVLGAWSLAVARARALGVNGADAQRAMAAEQRARVAAEASRPPPPPPAPVAELKASPVPEKREKLGLEVGVKVAAIFPSGRAGDVSAGADLPAVGSRIVVPGGSVAVRFRLPFARALAVAAEGGFTRLGGSGTRGFAFDPDFGPELSYRWQLDQVPVLLGLAWELPLGLPLAVAPVAGGAAVYTRSTASYVSGGVTTVDAPQEAWATGFYAGLELALPLGPGALTLEGRFLLARTDLGLSKLYDTVNTTPGNVQGTNVLAGYRFSF